MFVQSRLQVEARNVLLFSKREAARAGIVLPTADARARHISGHLQSQQGDFVRVGVVNGLKVSTEKRVALPRDGSRACRVNSTVQA